MGDRDPSSRARLGRTVDPSKIKNFARSHWPGATGKRASRKAVLKDVLAHADKPELYGLSANPTVPMTARVARGSLRWLGLVGVGGVLLGLVGHYLRFCPRAPRTSAGSPPPAA